MTDDDADLDEAQWAALVTSRFESLGDYLKTLDSNDWAVLGAILERSASAEITAASVRHLRKRLSEFMPEPSGDSSLTEGVLFDLLFLLARSHFWDEHIGAVSGRAGEDAVGRLRVLRAGFGEWIGDLHRAELDGERNWKSLGIVPVVRGTDSDEMATEITIELFDRSLLKLAMPMSSAVRLAYSMIGQLAEFPANFRASIDPDEVEALAVAVAKLTAGSSQSEGQGGVIETDAATGPPVLED